VHVPAPELEIEIVLAISLRDRLTASRCDSRAGLVPAPSRQPERDQGDGEGANECAIVRVLSHRPVCWLV
jgi:hypothetical protein